MPARSASFVLLGALTGGSLSGAALAAIAVATASAAGRVGFDSLLQRDGPDAVRGRAFAGFETRFQVAWLFERSSGSSRSVKASGSSRWACCCSSPVARTSPRCIPRTRPQRTTLRPEAVDRAFDKARDELRSRYRRSKSAKRREAAAQHRREADELDDAARAPAPDPARAARAPEPHALPTRRAVPTHPARAAAATAPPPSHQHPLVASLTATAGGVDASNAMRPHRPPRYFGSTVRSDPRVRGGPR